MDPQEIINRFMESLWNQRQLTVADELFPADFVAEPIAHQPFWSGTGPDSMKHHIQEWLVGMPDLQMKAIATAIQDDPAIQGHHAWVRWEMTGTHQGVLYGVPATGQSITALGVTLMDIQNNQIRTLRTIFDGLGLMQQLGVLPDATTLIRNYVARN